MSGAASRYSGTQLAALVKLFTLAERHLGTGGGNAAAKLLLGLYNGRRFPFDLTDLRRFDMGNFESAMVVLRMDALQTYAEVHVILDDTLSANDTQDRFEHWAFDLRLKGRCRKEFLRPLAASPALEEA